MSDTNQVRGMAIRVAICFVLGTATGDCLPVDAAASPTAKDAASSHAFSVLQRWKTGGLGGWDYLTLDASGQRLFISRGDHVDVLDTASGKVKGVIPNTKGVHGIALAEDLQRGFTSNGKSDSITVFDFNTLKVIKEVPLPSHNPDAILYDPSLKHIFTFNGRSNDVTVLDASSLAVLGTIPVADKPEFAVADGVGHIFVNIESEAGQMVEIDSRKLSVQATWSLPGCASPSGLALDQAHRRLFSVCDGGVMAVTDADTGKQIARVKIGGEPDATAFDAKNHLVFSSNGDGTLTVVRQDSADSYTVAQNLNTQRGARTMALNSSTGQIYLVTSEFGPPPAATAEQPHPRPTQVPDSFTVLVVGAR